MDRLFEWFVKFMLILIFAPLLVCLVLQATLGLLAALLPWLIAFSVITGLVAGLSAAFVLRRRLPLRNGGGPPPPGGQFIGQEPIRRPRGVRGQGEDR